MPAPHYDVAIIGLGAVGAAALYHAARLGLRAVGIDRYDPPHAMGSSHGETRITRCAVGEGDAYVPLVQRSHAIWRELEGQTGQTLFTKSGCLTLAARNVPAVHHGKPGFLDRTQQVARRWNIDLETLSTDEIRYRFPQFAGVGDETATFEPGAGFVYPERCIKAQLEIAASLGGTIRSNEAVLRIAQHGDGVEVTTDRGTISAARAIVAAGPWTGKLLGGAYAERLTVTRQLLHWFAAPAELYDPARFPAYIWLYGSTDEDLFYGFPSIPGSGEIKAATEVFGEGADPDRIERTVEAQEADLMLKRHIAGRLAGIADRPVRSAACMYSSTASSDFWIAPHVTMDRIVVASACSGHGFKHSTAIGEALAEQIALGSSRINLSAFSNAGLKRFWATRPREKPAGAAGPSLR